MHSCCTLGLSVNISMKQCSSVQGWRYCIQAQRPEHAKAAQHGCPLDWSFEHDLSVTLRWGSCVTLDVMAQNPEAGTSSTSLQAENVSANMPNMADASGKMPSEECKPSTSPSRTRMLVSGQLVGALRICLRNDALNNQIKPCVNVARDRSERCFCTATLGLQHRSAGCAWHAFGQCCISVVQGSLDQ